jgi:hypothetical protein
MEIVVAPVRAKPPAGRRALAATARPTRMSLRMPSSVRSKRQQERRSPMNLTPASMRVNAESQARLTVAMATDLDVA